MPLHPSHRPFIVPVFIPHAGCPHRCIFCNQNHATGKPDDLPEDADVRAAIEQFLTFRKDPTQKTEISFFGGNFLGLSSERIKTYLEIANSYIDIGLAQGIRFSTRPDTIGSQLLDLIKGYPIATVELGVQSMNNEVLALSQRGHTAQNTQNAVALLSDTGWRIGLQMMVGLPGDSPASVLESGRTIAALKPDFVRIYPCLVLEGSLLARWHAQGSYTPLSLEEAVDQVSALYTLFTRANIPVIRMGLQPTEHLNSESGIQAGPFHPAFGELVHSALWLKAIQKKVATSDFKNGSLEIRMHPKVVSRVIGQNRSNINAIQSQFTISDIHTVADASLPDASITINGQPLTIP